MCVCVSEQEWEGGGRTLARELGHWELIEIHLSVVPFITVYISFQ